MLPSRSSLLFQNLNILYSFLSLQTVLGVSGMKSGGSWDQYTDGVLLRFFSYLAALGGVRIDWHCMVGTVDQINLARLT